MQRRREHEKSPKTEEKIVYTAQYKANHSDLLLEFLLRKCNTSRNNVKNLLTRRQVLVNGSVVTQFDFPLGKDDEVKIAKQPQKQTETLKRKGVRALPPRDMPAILFEDEDLIAIDKPCGLLSVESDKERESAYSKVFSYLQCAGKNARPYILHRIDKETSGVLVFAKSPKVYSMLKMKWNEQVQQREYVALVEGCPAEKEGTIVSYLKENKNHLVYSTKDPSGQKAITNYRVTKCSEEYSLLSVQIETGRKNQIRVHMQTLGCPVVFDEKYGYTKNPIGRLGLHASKLVFLHPVSKELITLTAKLPPVFLTPFKDER